MMNYLKKLIGSIVVSVLLTSGAVAQTGIISGVDSLSLQNVITTAVPFLTITPDARSGGMGDVGAAISPDANAVYWNPAKVAFIQNDIGFALSYTPWLSRFINDMSVSYLSGYYKLDREQAIAVSMRYFDLGEIFFTGQNGEDLGLFNPREFSIDGTYSRILTENLSIGVVGRFIHSNLTGSFSSGTLEARPGSSVAVDLGVYYTKELIKSGNNSEISFGGVISNIGSKLTYSSEENQDFIPTNLRIGSAYTTNLDPYNKITIALDFNKLLVPTPPIFQLNDRGEVELDANGDPIILAGRDPDRTLLSGVFGSFSDAPDGFSEELSEITVSLGAEYWYNDLFAARAGYFYESERKGNRKYLTVGLGFRYQVFGIDFAYLVPQEQDHPLAETLRFSLLFNFDNKDSEDSSVTDSN
ncbi:MAG: type IX secretion system outer membrane channel protein PorV [Bacteroidota bacterium]